MLIRRKRKIDSPFWHELKKDSFCAFYSCHDNPVFLMFRLLLSLSLFMFPLSVLLYAKGLYLFKILVFPMEEDFNTICHLTRQQFEMILAE